MESLVVLTAIIVITITAGVFYLIFRRLQPPTSHLEPSWPKGKQYIAFRQNVTPIKKLLPSIIVVHFPPVGEKTPVQDVSAFFTSRGHEFSVYTIDWEREAVVLIRPVDGTNLKEDPFFFQAQRKNAVEVLIIPFEQLQAVVDAIADKVAHVHEVFVFNTARCGSTLLTRAVEATSVAQAVSESLAIELIFHQIIRLRQSQNPSSHRSGSTPTIHLNEESAVVLLRNVVTLLNYYFVSSDQQHRSVIFYKLMAPPVLAADLILRAFPNAKTIFLYRNGLEVAESWVRVMFKRQINYKAFRLFTRLGLWRLLPKVPDQKRLFQDDAKYATVRYRDSHFFHLVTLWPGSMQSAAELRKKYPDYFFHVVIYYTALARGKEETIRLLMEKLGLEWEERNQEEEWERVRAAFVGNSQEGALQSSRKSSPPGETWKPIRSTWTGEWEREYITDICTRSGNEVRGPDFLFPDTME